MRRLWLCVWLAAAGCEEFRPPSEIVEPQILGIRAVPAAIQPGQEARLEYFIAEVDGPLAEVPVQWSVLAGPGGAPPIGAVEEGDDGGAVYAAPVDLEVGDEPVLAAVQGVFSLPHREVIAVKTVAIGDARRDNPQIERVTLDGAALEAGGAAAPGAEIELAVEADVPLDEVNDVTWAATRGELEHFLRTPATWSLPPGAGGTAWLYVVVRDGEGGADWAAFEIALEP